MIDMEYVEKVKKDKEKKGKKDIIMKNEEKHFIVSGDFGKYFSNLIGKELRKNDEILKMEKELDEKENSLIRINIRTKKHDLDKGFIDKEGENSYKIKFLDKEYIVGEQGTEKVHGTSKTHLTHQLCCYTAITRLLEPNTTNNKIHMVIACPSSVLKIAKSKEEYKEFMSNGGNLIEIEVDGEHYEFTIEDIMVKAEGSGIVYLESDLFRNKDVAIIDLGGLNMGFGLYRNGSCKITERFTAVCGTDRLVELVGESISEYLNGDVLTEDENKKILDDNGVKVKGQVDEKSVVYVKKAKENYLNEIIDITKNKKIDLEKLDKIIFVGGTSLHIKDEINERYSDFAKVSSNAHVATVEGLFKVALKRYGNILN